MRYVDNGPGYMYGGYSISRKSLDIHVETSSRNHVKSTFKWEAKKDGSVTSFKKLGRLWS